MCRRLECQLQLLVYVWHWGYHCCFPLCVWLWVLIVNSFLHVRFACQKNECPSDWHRRIVKSSHCLMPWCEDPFTEVGGICSLHWALDVQIVQSSKPIHQVDWSLHASCPNQFFFLFLLVVESIGTDYLLIQCNHWMRKQKMYSFYSIQKPAAGFLAWSRA